MVVLMDMTIIMAVDIITMELHIITAPLITTTVGDITMAAPTEMVIITTEVDVFMVEDIPEGTPEEIIEVIGDLTEATEVTEVIEEPEVTEVIEATEVTEVIEEPEDRIDTPEAEAIEGQEVPDDQEVLDDRGDREAGIEAEDKFTLKIIQI